MIRERVKRLIAGERKSPPERAVNIPAVRRTYSGIRNAYCKTDAGTGATIVCYLDTDATGEEVTVHCTICDESDLNAAAPRLSDGDLIPVYYDGTNWRSCTVFNGSEVCS